MTTAGLAPDPVLQLPVTGADRPGAPPLLLLWLGKRQFDPPPAANVLSAALARLRNPKAVSDLPLWMKVTMRHIELGRYLGS